MAIKTGITWEAFLAAGEEGQRWEYVDGEVEGRPLVSSSGNSGFADYDFVEYRKQHPKWLCFPGDATFTMASGNLRCRDLSIVHASRFPHGKVPETNADFPPTSCSRFPQVIRFPRLRANTRTTRKAGHSGVD
jgi:Uma2 family endonuclease